MSSGSPRHSIRTGPLGGMAYVRSALFGTGGISSYLRVNSRSLQFGWLTAWSLNRFFSVADRLTPNTTPACSAPLPAQSAGKSPCP